MKSTKITKAMALIVAVCMVAGLAVGVFMAWPPLLPILLAACLAGYVFYRYKKSKG